MSHPLDAKIDTLRTQLNKLELQRDDAIRAAHTLTAADFRIRIESDPGYFTFEDIVGDVDEADKNDPESYYSQFYEAYHNGDGVESWCVVLEQRDPASDDWNMLDSCSGFFSIDDGPDYALTNTMLNHVADWIPSHIILADIAVEFE